MKTIGLLVPALLSQFLLAAHFLRAGDWLFVGAALALAFLLGHRRSWVARLTQVWLLAGSAVWVGTLLRLWRQRTAMGMPWGRMAVILGAVAAFTALAALLFETGRLKRLYRRQNGAEET